VVRIDDIRRVDFGYFVRPADETGTGAPRVEPVLGYVLRTPAGVLLFDTGMGQGPPELDDHYRPARIALPAALAAVGLEPADVSVVVNCHLHFDHCGGNPDLAHARIVTQRTELEAARTEQDYTLPHLVAFAGAGYEEVDGEAAVFDGVLVLPTPGHTVGHQSLLVMCSDGTVVVAGQAHDNATGYTSAQLARRAALDGHAAPLPEFAGWMERIAQLDPRRVLFAHDNSVWEPATTR
jgi:N-acyl homoserine lactone hydrolase